MTKRVRRVLVAGILAISMITLSGCASQEDLDNTLNNLAQLGEEAKDSLDSAVGVAEDAINQVGEAAGWNGEYDSTTEMLGAAVDDLKNQVVTKLDEIDPNYGAQLEQMLADLETADDNMVDVTAEVPVEDTETYAFFNTFDKDLYDLEFSIYDASAEGKTFVRNRVVVDKQDGTLDAYSSSYTFNLSETAPFEMFGLSYNACENDTWYFCNSVTQTKSIDETPLGYTSAEKILAGYDVTAYRSSTTNNIIKTTGISVDRFVTDKAIVSFVFKEGNLVGVIYNVGEKTSYIIVTKAVSGDAVERSFIDASKSFKVE